MGVIDCCGMRHMKPYGLPLDHTRGAATVPLQSYFVKCDINPAKEMMMVSCVHSHNVVVAALMS